MCRLRPVLLFFLLLSACGGGGGGGGQPPPPQVTTYYVRESGSDDNDGATTDTAFRTLEYVATNIVKPGITVIVGPGTYNASVPQPGESGAAVDIADVAGTASHPLQFIADTSGAMTGDPPGPVLIDANGRTLGFRISRSSYVTIEGFTIRGGRGNNGAGIQVRSLSPNATIRDCAITSNADGIRVQNSNSVLIFNNLITGNSNRGIRLADGSQDARVINNTIVGNLDRGISIGGANDDGVASVNATVRNNIIQSNSNVSISIDDGPPSSLPGYTGNYNLVFYPNLMDQTKTYRPTTIRGQNDINMDAVFIDEAGGDFHLDQSSSPAIDTGNGAVDAALVSQLFSRSTAADGAPDAAPIDLGYHYPAADTAP